MKSNNLIYKINFPDVLSNDEFSDYYYLFKKGDMNARNILIERNMKLVESIVRNKFLDSGFELEELFEIGMIGLVKAIDSFDIELNNKISTYASKCIQNEILMYMRKNKNNIDIFSLDAPIVCDLDNLITFGELLEDDKIDLENDMIKLELERNIIRLVFNVLDDREKRILMMYYGFKNNKLYNHEEIAVELNVHRATVTKIITRSLKKIKQEILLNTKCLELVECLGIDKDEILRKHSKIRG